MPLPSISTDRVLLRSLRRDDVDAVHSLWTKPEVRRFLWDDIVITREVACAAALGYLSRSTSYQRVYARTDPPNLKSVQVMVQLGMVQESTTASMITYMLHRPGRD